MLLSSATMQTSYAVSYETWVVIQLICLMLSYTPEKIPIAISMAVSRMAVIERNATKVALFNLQATLPRCRQQTKKSLFTGILHQTGKRRETSIGFYRSHLPHILTKRYRSFCLWLWFRRCHSSYHNMKRSSLQSSINKGAIVYFSSGPAGVFYFCCLIGIRMAQISLRLLRLVFSKIDSDCYAHGCF